MTKVSDLFYVQRVKAGDVKAFTEIVSRYGDMVFTLVRKIVSTREDAEDITQEVFIKVFQSLERFREESNFSTWLYRIAYNTTISELRKKKLFFVSSADDNAILATDSDNTDDIEIKLQYLETALKRLSSDEAFLITLYYMDEQSIDKISKISNLSISNVKVKLHRIRKKLTLEIHKLMHNE
jgi:RNA polymerase sigma-70 factor (ECF subfamily)